MARFFFLDQSLKGLGGHHFDYATHVTRAALDEGFEVVLGTHRAFRNEGDFPNECELAPVFRHTTYSHCSVFAPKDAGIPGVSEAKRFGFLRSYKRWIRSRNLEHRRRHLIHAFVEDFRRLFDQYPHRPGDHVFLATVADLELHALAEYAFHAPTSRVATWHLQFHFNLFQGRPHEYESQRARLTECRKWVQPAFQKLGRHAVHYYNTSVELAEQYQQLGLAEFRSLVYPVNPCLQASQRYSVGEQSLQKVDSEGDSACVSNRSDQNSESHSTVPLRVTLAGAVRPEKGQEQLRELVSGIKEPLLETGKIQLVVQRKRRSRYRRQQVDLTEVLGSSMSRTDACPIEYVEHPLDEQAYEMLLKRANIGLFLYDGRTYYARRAGVLGEFLSLGVPVVVPAACWLSEQFRNANEEYYSELFETADDRVQPCCHLEALKSRPDFELKPGTCYPIGLEGNPHRQRLLIRCRAAVKHGGTGFVRFDLASTPVSGATLSMIPNAGIIPTGGVSHESSCASLQSISRESYLMLDLPPSLEHTLEISAAFGDSRIQLDQIEIVKLPETQPLGVVGLVAADPKQVPLLLQELQTHYRHYQQSAVKFSASWYQTHDSNQVVKQLMHQSQRQPRRAA